MTIDPLRSLPGYSLKRASHITMSELAKRLDPLGLSSIEASVLAVIDANKKITQSSISKLLGIATANLTPLVARLDGRGLIKRTRVDGRTQHLSLTASGHALAVRALAEMNALEDQMFERIPVRHRQGFLAGLEAIWGWKPKP